MAELYYDDTFLIGGKSTIQNAENPAVGYPRYRGGAVPEKFKTE
jgi:hypothetical protein